MKFSRLVLVFEEMEKKSSRLAITHDVSEVFKTCSPKEAKRVTRLMQGIVAPSHEGIELGMADKLAMRAIEIVSGKSGKEVAAAYRKKGDLGDAAEELLAHRRQHALAHTELSVEKVYDNFYKIAAAGGGGSQDHKVKLLAELLSNAEPNEAKIIIRFVTGSLRLGAGESTITDALSEALSGSKELSDEIERAFNLTSDLGAVAELLFEKGMQSVSAIKPKPFNPIKPALAERLENAQAIIEKIGGGGSEKGAGGVRSGSGAAGGVRGCSVEGKFDGFRLAVHKKGSRVEFYSRRQERVTHMFPDLAEAFKKQVAADEIICEGEAIGFNDATGTFLPFQETMQRKRKHGVAEKAEEIPLKLFLFELLYFDGTDFTQKPY
ncbi:MAG: ATP-dependent DNA ligase, partial [Candidatus Micrarchaeota archaeon]